MVDIVNQENQEQRQEIQEERVETGTGKSEKTAEEIFAQVDQLSREKAPWSNSISVEEHEATKESEEVSEENIDPVIKAYMTKHDVDADIAKLLFEKYGALPEEPAEKPIVKPDDLDPRAKALIEDMGISVEEALYLVAEEDREKGETEKPKQKQDSEDAHTPEAILEKITDDYQITPPPPPPVDSEILKNIQNELSKRAEHNFAQAMDYYIEKYQAISPHISIEQAEKLARADAEREVKTAYMNEVAQVEQILGSDMQQYQQHVDNYIDRHPANKFIRQTESILKDNPFNGDPKHDAIHLSNLFLHFGKMSKKSKPQPKTKTKEPADIAKEAKLLKQLKVYRQNKGKDMPSVKQAATLEGGTRPPKEKPVLNSMEKELCKKMGIDENNFLKYRKR